jgi:hypothetical protein
LGPAKGVAEAVGGGDADYDAGEATEEAEDEGLN